MGRIAGTTYFKLDGEQLSLTGGIEVPLNTVSRDDVMRRNTIKGKPDDRAVLSLESGNIQSHSHNGTVAGTDLGSPITDYFDYGTKEAAWVDDHIHGFGVWGNDDAGGVAADGSEWISGTAYTEPAGGHAHPVAIGGHSHYVALGVHGHGLTIDATGGPETTVANIAFNYIVRLA